VTALSQTDALAVGFPALKGTPMRIVIKVSARDCAKAWGTLVRHSPGMALPGRRFIVSEEALHALERAGIKYKELSREGSYSGEIAGERI
jgi:hypothetical protein